MKDFGKTRSTVKPDAVVIDDNSVWVHTDIQEVHESVGEDQSFDGYEFNMVQYVWTSAREMERPNFFGSVTRTSL